MAPRPGSPAPAFDLATHNGGSLSSDDTAGRWLLLWWYPRASTPTCTREGRGLQAAASGFERAGCRVVGVSYDEPEANLHFAEEQGFDFPLLSDPDREVSTRYGTVRAAGEPYDDMPLRRSFLIDPDGTIRRVYDVTDADAHAEEVIADIAELTHNLIDRT